MVTAEELHIFLLARRHYSNKREIHEVAMYGHQVNMVDSGVKRGEKSN
jgi:hypothetical protein